MRKVTIYGIISLISISPLFRGLLFKYETYAFLAVISLLSFLYFISKIKNDEPLHINRICTVLGIALVAANVISFINALNPRENLSSLIMYTVFLIVFIVFYDYFFDKKYQFMKTLMLMMMPTGLICAVIGMEALTGSFSFLDVTLFGKRLGSSFQYTNTAAIYFTVCFLFAITLASTLKSHIFKGFISGAGNLFIFALFLTGSRGGCLTAMAVILLFLVMQPSGSRLKGITNLICMIAPLIITFHQFSTSAATHDYLTSTVWMVVSVMTAIALYYVFYFLGALISRLIFKGRSVELPKSSGFIFAALFIVVLAAAVVFRRQFLSLLPAVLSSRLDKLNLNDSNILFRFQFGKDALKLISDNWLTGLGGGGWLAIYQSIQDTFYTANFIHNNYLQVFTEAGILGFISYTAMVLASFANAIISFFKSREKTAKVYITGLLTSFIALAVHSSFDFDLTYTSLALFFWMMFAATAVNRSDERNKRWVITGMRKVYTIIPVIICALLFSIYTLFFTGAYNYNIGTNYAKSGDYRTAMFYYEEANRLDPQNSDYLFELSKINYYFAGIERNEDKKIILLKKAETAGEMSLRQNRCYPPQYKTLIRIYRDLNMPEKYVEYCKQLVFYQWRNETNYALLAECYLDAAKFYAGRNDLANAKQLLYECIELKKVFAKQEKEDWIITVLKKDIDICNGPSDKTESYFKEAENTLQKLAN